MNPIHPPTAAPDPNEVNAESNLEDDRTAGRQPPSSVREAIEVQDRRWRTPTLEHDCTDCQD